MFGEQLKLKDVTQLKLMNSILLKDDEKCPPTEPGLFTWLPLESTINLKVEKAYRNYFSEY